MIWTKCKILSSFTVHAQLALITQAKPISNCSNKRPKKEVKWDWQKKRSTDVETSYCLQYKKSNTGDLHKTGKSLKTCKYKSYKRWTLIWYFYIVMYPHP